MIGEDIASAGVNNDAGACAQPLLLLRQVEIATEEGIVVKRIGFGGSANVDDRRRDVLQDISGRGLSAADIADCGRAAGSGAGMRTSEANTPTYFDERVVIFGPELLSSSFGAGGGPSGPVSSEPRFWLLPNQHQFDKRRADSSAMHLLLHKSIQSPRPVGGRGPIIAVRSPCRLPASAGAVHPSSASRRPWPRW